MTRLPPSLLALLVLALPGCTMRVSVGPTWGPSEGIGVRANIGYGRLFARRGDDGVVRGAAVVPTLAGQWVPGRNLEGWIGTTAEYISVPNLQTPPWGFRAGVTGGGWISSDRTMRPTAGATVSLLRAIHATHVRTDSAGVEATCDAVPFEVGSSLRCGLFLLFEMDTYDDRGGPYY